MNTAEKQEWYDKLRATPPSDCKGINALMDHILDKLELELYPDPFAEPIEEETDADFNGDYYEYYGVSTKDFY